MKRMSLAVSVALVAGIAVWSTSFAQAPAGSTGECKDGTYTSAGSKRGACAAHGGVKDWYGSSKKSESKSTKKEKETKSTDKSATGSTAAAAPAPAEAPPKKSSSSMSTSTPAKAQQSSMRSEAAPGGGAGKVWVNTSSKVYHCSGDEWYGKTKEGEYMSEAQAKASGARASRGKACS